MKSLKAIAVAALFALSLGCSGAFANCVSSPSDTTSTFPSTLTGKLAWHSYTAYGDGSSQLFIRDIAAGSTTNISSSWACASGCTVKDPMNAVFSPDGNWLLFMGVANNAWNLWAWKTDGSHAPYNLTGSTGTTREEDPKFNVDGTKVIWKQKQSTTFRIQSAAFTVTGSTPSLGTQSTLVTGTTENSMPYLNSASTTLYYSPGSGSPFTLKSQPYSGGTVSSLSTSGYYPTVRWSDDTVFWADDTTQGSNDQIAYRTGGSGTTVYPAINDCNGNNSDQWPVASTNYVFFSSTTPGGYQLYLGDLSSGTRWNLSGWYSDTGKAHLGSSYSSGTSGGGGGTGGGCATSGTDVNLAAGKLATASSSYNGTTLAPGKAVDGNTSSTRWDSLEPMPLPTWLQVDLGANKHVDGIDLYWDAAAKNYTVDYSTDGTSWTNLVTQSTAGASFTHKAFSGLSACGRYVRVNGTTADTAYGMALWEVQVWGY